MVVVAQTPNQIKRLALCERLTAGDLYELTTELTHAFDNRVDGEMVAAGEGVFAVTPATAHGTARQTNKRARTPCMR